MLTLAEILSDFAVFAGLPVDGISIASRTAVGETPMHWMATLGDHKAIAILIGAGANINAAANNGNTPLHEAVLYRQASAVAALLASNADYRKRNVAEISPMEMARTDKFEPILKLFDSIEK